MRYAESEQLRRRSLPGECPLLFPVNILTANSHVRPLGRLDRCRQIKKRRAYHNFIARVSGNQRQEFAEEVASLVGRLVHLPVGGHYFCSHESAFRINSPSPALL